MSIYKYIAENDPGAAAGVCQKFGYNLKSVETSDGLANCLEQLVAHEGKPAFLEIMDLHPDKEVITEIYGSGLAASPVDPGKKCKCRNPKATQDYLQSTNNNNNLINGHLHQGNVFLFAGIVLLGVVLVVVNK